MMQTAPTGRAPLDEVAAALAAFAVNAPMKLDDATAASARLVLLDTFAVSVNALDHPAAEAARRYARLFATREGAVIWGSALRASPEIAAVVNGVPLRAYDYNDLYIGARNGGHPSDIVPGLLAMAEWAGSTGRDFLQALALGYEVTLHLLDVFAAGKRGWDYVNLTSIGATCAIGRLIGLSEAQLREALAITVMPHAASNELESGELNARGDLTMWKRFNGGDAVRQSAYACLLASVGVEGVVRPFVGKLGFVNQVGGDDGGVHALLERLSKPAIGRITQTTFKRWPVGSRAQSAIQAALAARGQITDTAAIAKVRVFTGDGVYQHLVASREAPWQPISRETADHSLPYIIAATVLDGMLDSASFTPGKVDDPVRRQFLADKVAVEVETALGQGAPGEFRSRIEITLSDGRVVHGPAASPPGHPLNPFSEADMIGKLRDIAGAKLGERGIEALIAAVRGLDSAATVGALAHTLAVAE